MLCGTTVGILPVGLLESQTIDQGYLTGFVLIGLVAVVASTALLVERR